MIQFTLPSMTCGHCVKTVTSIVKQVDASAAVQIDLPTHQVTIQSALPANLFRAALAEDGYQAA